MPRPPTAARRRGRHRRTRSGRRGRERGMRRAEPSPHRVDPADRGNRNESERDRAAHLEQVLEAVRRRDAPVTGEHRVERGQKEADDEGGPLREAEHPSEHFRHPEVHPAHDDDVDKETEVRRAEAAQKRGGPSGVTELRQLDVGHHGRAPPELREEEDRQHPGREHRPPQPVPGDPVLGHHLGDGERRVGGEGGRDHRRSRDPPRHRARGEEVIEHGALRPAREEESDGEGHREIATQHQEVQTAELHRSTVIASSPSRSRFRGRQPPRS